MKSGAITLKNFLDNTKNQERTRKDISWTALAWTHESKRCHSVLLTKVFQTMERILFTSKCQLKNVDCKVGDKWVMTSVRVGGVCIDLALKQAVQLSNQNQ